MRLDVGGFVAAAWRRRRLALAVAGMVCVVGWSALAATAAGDAAPADERATPSAEDAPALDHLRARLRADLEAARALRLELQVALVATPATLGAGDAARSNPIHQRLRAQEERHRQLIQTLERRWAALRRRERAGAAAGARHQPSAGIGDAALVAAVPLAGLALGLVLAGWRGRRDDVFDGVGRLRSTVGLPVLGVIGRVRRGSWS